MSTRRSGSSLTNCWLCQLGQAPYIQAFDLQRRLAQLRFEGRIDDILLLLEHPPTVTLGRFGRVTNLLLPPDELGRRGISFARTDRGGDVTFHCPGQLVAYPIIDLKPRGGRLRDFLFKLEEVALLTLRSYDIPAERWSEHPGIWVTGRQIGAVGLRVARGITLHGLSLNVNPDLTQFGCINLCGLPGKQATSISAQLGVSVSVAAAAKRMQSHFGHVFQVELTSISARQVKEDALVIPCPPALV